ncbi:hypothetical protein KR038_000890, partial [Drosophila bunnanda]
MAQKAIDVALKRFIATTDRVSQFEANLHTPGTPETEQFSPFTCQVHRDQIRDLWEKVEKNYESCFELLSTSDDGAATSTVLESKYSYCYSVYSRCVAKLEETISQAASQSARAANSVFAGDYLRWPTFKNLFTAIYIHNSRITPVEKLFHLLSKTSGDANAIVAPLTNKGFASAWRSLTVRFENRRLLVNSQLKILFNIQAVPQESGVALKDLQGTIQSCLAALEMSSIQVEAWDCILVYMVSTKLPKITLSL